MANNFLKIKNGATLRQQGTVPANPVNGDIYYDSNQNSFVIYNNGVWMNLTSRVDVAGATNLTSTTLTSAVSQNTLIRITGTTTTNLCGLAASSGGKQVVIYNDTTESLSLKYQDTTEPVAANRLTNSTSTDVVLKTGQTAVLIYDDVADIWIVASSPSSGGIEAPGPTVQKFLSGSGTYTTPPNVSFIEVEMVGGGGGGGGADIISGIDTSGTAGGTSTFGSFLTATGGLPGDRNSGNPSSGGTATVSLPALQVIAVSGGQGTSPAVLYTPAQSFWTGGSGGASALGGAGGGGANSAGGAASPNTGGGGGGGGTQNQNDQIFAGSGGGAGGYLKAIIVSPAQTYSYSVGAGGTGGPSGADGDDGGNGGSGLIVVTEYYYNGLGALAGNGGAYTPTITTLTSGSGTFTTPVNASYIRVQMVGGGGGGSSGGTGGNTTFGTILSANAGSAGGGGGYVINAPATGYGIPGTIGDSTIFVSASGPNYNYLPGGNGANSVFGGAGAGGADNSVGNNGIANTGAGGGGGSSNPASLGAESLTSGQGGGAGGYVDAIIVNPSSSYAYTVGAGGAGGSANTYYNAGGNGASGIIIITTYYNNGAVGTATNVTGTVQVAHGGTGNTSWPTMRASCSNTVSFGNSDTVIAFNNTIYDSASAYNPSSGLYTCPIAGKYRVTAKLLSGSVTWTAVNEDFAVKLYRNSSVDCIMGENVIQAPGSYAGAVNGSVTIQCAQGDILNIAAYSAQTTALDGDPQRNYLCIEWVGP